MSRARRNRIVGIVMVSMLGGFVTLAACSDQGEGERCQAENGNDDCTAPLVCLAGGQKPFNGGVGFVNAPFQNSDRCCPFDRSTATHPACVLLSTSITPDGSIPPPDTGPVPDAPIDSPPDTNTTPDAADASSDADAD
jgi:hypothetical protein